MLIRIKLSLIQKRGSQMKGRIGILNNLGFKYMKLVLWNWQGGDIYRAYYFSNLFGLELYFQTYFTPPIKPILEDQ